MSDNHATRRAPLILVRGFGGVGVEDEKRIAYLGFNDGTVLRKARRELHLRRIGSPVHEIGLAVSRCDERGRIPRTVDVAIDIPADLKHFDEHYFKGDVNRHRRRMALNLLKSAGDPCRTLWVFRYYDLDDRRFETYGKALVRHHLSP